MPHPVDIHAGNRLKLRRSILGLSQGDVAKAIGVTFQQVQKYERGVNRMGSSRLYELAKTLNMPVTYFFDEYQPDGQPSPAEGMAESPSSAFEHEEMTSRETMEMMRAYYKIKSPAMRKRVFELVKSMAEASAEQSA